MAINHQQPDRVPLGLISPNRDIYQRLTKHFGLPPHDYDGLLAALNIDMRLLGVPYVGPVLHPPLPDREVDPLWGVHTRLVKTATCDYWDYCDFPLKNATLEEVEAWPMPSPDDYDYTVIPAECQRHADKFVVYGHPGTPDVINSTGMIRTMEQVFMDMATEDPVGMAIFQKRTASMLATMERALDAAKGGIDLIWMGEDLGTQYTPIIGLDMYRRIVRPHHQQFADLARKFNVPVMIHSCGACDWVFSDLLEMGITVHDAVQPEAKNMSPAEVKKNWGDRMSFHGCISVAGPLSHGTVDQVVEYVKKTIDIRKPNGGYIVAPTNMLQDCTPVENVVAMYETARTYGKY